MLHSQRQHSFGRAHCATRQSTKPIRGLCKVHTAAVDVQTVSQLLELEPAVAQQLEQACAGITAHQLQENVQELRKDYFLKDVQRLAAVSPQAFAVPIADWRNFFEGYGLGKEAFWKALRYSSSHLAAGDVYTAGAAIRWLKQLGPWNDADVANRLIPCYPEVLSTPTDTLQQLVDKLLGLGMDHSSVQQFLWEFPGMMADYREEQLPLVVRMVDSRRNKYTNGGTYID